MNDLQRLKEMGITVWDIRHPVVFPENMTTAITLPPSCKLLFVSESAPNDHEAWLFGKILASMKLTPEQALRLPPRALSALGEHSLEWSWFSGVSAQALPNVKALSSPSLSALNDDQNAKKALWKQIKNYEN
ncbi:DNA polymerase III subunit psi [Enterovibrio norvegicus FF-454]|uniref:DNA polymerase III subunit psi n=1 Tax=Enterovibrio norvegicus FF-454 TaxID=1185651 RepID=A0A1E5BWA4_9GAMM|nr:DNA polymerase III subunit psi [Enterovibrio norvegicus]OEE57538.1 DNA polymerase III subunit psi [Enterovibrio norvegicus FF-454]